MNGKKVLVAMSGGVDSSVAALLLQRQGYFTAGAYMKNFSAETWSGVLQQDCPWEQDQQDAQAVCAKLGIEFQSFNFEKEYREKVIEYFFAEYAAGRTPNPDIMCNKEIKFKLFLQKALDLGFDYIATGHYARIRKIKSSGLPSAVCRLLKGLDPKKDQTYFLYTLNQSQLAHSLFPIGEYTKPRVRQLARELGLPNAEKKDSQGICFIGHINLREFLKQRIPERVGEIVTTTGQIMGRHKGAAYYTIGQRQGLGIGGGIPYYVAEKNMLKNEIVVTRGRQDSAIYKTEVRIANPHWIGKELKLPLSCTAKIRYQQPDQKCELLKRGDKWIVKFREAQFAPASGQAVVFYDRTEILGGATIK